MEDILVVEVAEVCSFDTAAAAVAVGWKDMREEERRERNMDSADTDSATVLPLVDRCNCSCMPFWIYLVYLDS